MKLLILCSVFLFSFNLQAQSPRQAFGQEILSCGSETKPQGGVDAFPWSFAKPFPWNSIQGTWISIDEKIKHLNFQFKVVRTTESTKQLAVQIFDTKNCKKPAVKGIGLISDIENVLRVFLRGDVMIQMAMFSAKDLGFDISSEKNLCESKMLGATVYYKLSEDESEPVDSKLLFDLSNETSLVLKKITSKTSISCRK